MDPINPKSKKGIAHWQRVYSTNKHLPKYVWDSYTPQEQLDIFGTTYSSSAQNIKSPLKAFNPLLNSKSPYGGIGGATDWVMGNDSLLDNSTKNFKDRREFLLNNAYNTKTGEKLKTAASNSSLPAVRPKNINTSKDALGLFLGEGQTNNSFGISSYKPSKSTQDVNYYKFNDESEIINDLFKRNNKDFISSDEQERLVTGSHVGQAALKNYKYSKGKDEKGPYVSYYDKNDYGNALDVVGNPFEIYNRIYYDEKTKQPKFKNGGTMKGKYKPKDLKAYFGSYLDAIQGDPNAIQGLDPTLPVYNSPFRDNPAGAIDKPYGDPYVQSNTMATSAQQDSLMMKNRDYKNLPSDEQQFVKEENKKVKDKKGNPIPQVQIKSLVGSIFPFINALVGERDPVRTKPFEPLQVYNPHPLGTGSQALYKDGGKLSPSKAKEMLRDGTANGKKLTKKQKRYFGMVAAGKADMGVELDPVPARVFGDSDYRMYENVNSILALGGNPMDSPYGKQLLGSKQGQALIDNLTIFNANDGNKALTPQQRLMSYYNVHSNNKHVDGFKNKARNYGMGPVASYNDGPDVEKINLSHNPIPKKPPLIAEAKKDGGKIDKAFWGAIAGAAGGQAGGGVFSELQKTAKEQTKLAAQAPQEIMNFIAQMAQFKDEFNQSGGYSPGPYVQPDQMRYMDSGGQVNGQNQIRLHDEGSVQLLSYNPYDGGTMQFSGPSHAHNGIDMSYGNFRVDAEGGETAVKDNEGNLHIMGNMKVPGSKVKFKSVSKKIADKEEEYTSLKSKGVALVNTLDPRDKYDRLSFNAGQLMMEGGDMGQRDLAKKKLELANLQNALLSTAQEFNLDPEALSEGRERKAKKSTFKAASGASLFGDPIPRKRAMADRMNNPGNIKYGEFAKKLGAVKGEPATDGGHFAKFPDPETGLNAARKLLQTNAYKNLPVEEAIKKWTGGKGYGLPLGDLSGKTIRKLSDEQLGSLVSTIAKGEGGKYFSPGSYSVPNFRTPNPQEEIGAPESPLAPFTPFKLPTVPLTYKPPSHVVPDNPEAPPVEDVIPPQDRNIPSNVRGLSLAQVLPELLAMGSNQLEPVAARQYQPELEQPYQVSFQDRLNENQATFNALQRQIGNNPLALSSLSAQQYQADSGVLADEFRVNQGEANRVYNANRNTLNDAQLKNLGIADQQYARQAQAKSNTKAQTQAIANSLAAKFTQNRVENQKLALYENLYNFRAQDTNNDGLDDKMVNYNPTPVFDYNMAQTGSPSAAYQRIQEKKDAAGILKQQTITTPSAAEQRLQDLKIQKAEEQRSLIPILKRFKTLF